MSKKVFNLITGIIGGVETISIACVTYFCETTIAASINSSIVIAGTAVIEICNMFVKE